MPSTDRSTRFIALLAVVLAVTSIVMQVRDRIGTRSVITQRLSLQDDTDATRAQIHLVAQDPALTAFLPDGKVVQMTLKQRGPTLSVDIHVDGTQINTITLTPDVTPDVP